jgi:hypothetical protein
MNTRVIEVNPDTVTVDYTLPLPVDKDRTSSKEVLSINRIGSTHWKHSKLLFEKKHLILALQRSGIDGPYKTIEDIAKEIAMRSSRDVLYYSLSSP